MSNGIVASGDSTVHASNAETVKQKRWVCDVCKVKWFLDYAEACDHEKNCTGPPPPQKCKLAPNLPGGTGEPGAGDRKAGTATEISTNSIRAEGRSGRQHQQAGNRTTHREGSSGNADEEESSRDQSESAGSAVSKLKSKRLRDVPKLRQQQQPEKKNKKTKTAVKAGKSGKSTSTKKSKGTTGGGQLASIFMPQRKPTTTTASSTGTKSKTVKQHEIPAGVTEEEYDEHVAAEKVASRKRRTADPPIGKRISHRRNRRKIVESDSEGDFLSESDVEEVKIIEPKSKGRRGKTTKNDCFLSTKAKAEHQAADFFAKRRALQAEERERQKKRNEIKMARLGTSSSKVTDGAKQSPAKCATVSVKENGLEAVRFPCPSHIAPGKDSQDSRSSESSSAHRLAPKYQHAKPDLSTPAADDSNDRLGFYTTADQAEDKGDNFAFDLLSSVFNATTNKADSKGAGQIWSDKYAASSIPDDILGEKNKVKAQKLLDFIEEWKVKRHQSMESLGQVKRKKKRRKKKKSGYDTDDSFLDDDRLESIMIITGHSATGKTTLVHSGN